MTFIDLWWDDDAQAPWTDRHNIAAIVLLGVLIVLLIRDRLMRGRRP